MKRTIYGRLVPALLVMLLPTLVVAAERSKRLRAGDYNPENETVELFQAIEDAQLEVKVIPKSSKQCRVLITNKTDKPLNIQLPETFAAMPVVAQFGGGGFGDAGGGGGGGGGGGHRPSAGRSSRSSSSSGGSQSSGGGMGGGMFNVSPEKVGDMKVTTVCLEHGKDEPRPQAAYRIEPLKTFTEKPEVEELCRMLGNGELPQRAAQAASWHYTDGMSWEELAAKQIEHVNGLKEPYFKASELQMAMGISKEVERRLEEKKKTQDENESSLHQGQYTEEQN